MTEFLRKNKLAVAGLNIVVVPTAVGLFAPWFAPDDLADQRLIERLEEPSWKHPFGNDELGRDILSRILLGIRVSMRVGATVVLFSGIIGVLVGGFAGYIGGKVGTFVTVVVLSDVLPMVVFPSIALVLTVLSFNFLGDALRDWLDPRSLG